MFYRRCSNPIMSAYEKLKPPIWPMIWFVLKWSLVIYIIFEIASCSMGAYFKLSSAINASIP